MISDAKKDIFPELLDVIYNLVAINCDIALYLASNEIVKHLLSINSYVKENKVTIPIYYL